MKFALYFICKYFWLFSGFGLMLVGDVLFVMKSIQDVNSTINTYKENGKGKEYLKGKFVAPTICLICNIVFGLMIASFIYYASLHLI